MVETVPIGEDARDLRPGDFILCHRSGFTSWCIRAGERLRFRRALVSHAAFCETDVTLIEALTHGIKRTPLAYYRQTQYYVVRTRLWPLDAVQARNFAQSCVGDRYGFLIDLGVALRFLTPGKGLWFGMNGTEMCSGLVAQAQVRGWTNFSENPASISPQGLYEHYATA
jgi:hypothetical protein